MKIELEFTPKLKDDYLTFFIDEKVYSCEVIYDYEWLRIDERYKITAKLYKILDEEDEPYELTEREFEALLEEINSRFDYEDLEEFTTSLYEDYE